MFVGPKIVKDGLILHIDAGSLRCYVSGSTSGSNLVSGQPLTGASGSPAAGPHTPDPAAWPDYLPTFGGIFDFDGTTTGINVEEDLGSNNTFTYCIWYYKSNTSSTDYFTDARNDGGTYLLSNYLGGNLNGGNAFKYLYEDPYNANSTLFLDRWQFIAYTSDAGGSDVYLNGYHYSESPIFNTTLSSSNSVSEPYGKNFRVGVRYTGDTGWWDGQLGNMMFYNRVLTADEVKQNYNATCTRYGLNRV